MGDSVMEEGQAKPQIKNPPAWESGFCRQFPDIIHDGGVFGTGDTGVLKIGSNEFYGNIRRWWFVHHRGVAQQVIEFNQNMVCEDDPLVAFA